MKSVIMSVWLLTDGIGSLIVIIVTELDFIQRQVSQLVLNYNLNRFQMGQLGFEFNFRLSNTSCSVVSWFLQLFSS